MEGKPPRSQPALLEQQREPDFVNVHDAKTNLSRLLARVEAGEEIVIGRAGKPVAKLVPFPTPRLPRIGGRLRGQIVIHDDFDELPEDILAAFNGEMP